MASGALRAGVILATSTAALGFATAVSATDLYVRALGPVDRVDNATRLSVLGQSFNITTNADGVLDGRHVAHASSLLPLLSSSSGVTVAVMSSGPGPDASRLVVQTQVPYVPGASSVAAAGLVRAVDRNIATLWIGLARVDYSAVLSVDPNFDPQLGNFVQILGTRPASSSPILASRAQVIATRAEPEGITGSARADGITGSARADGITGSASGDGITGSARASQE